MTLPDNNIRERQEEEEARNLASQASLSARSRGRQRTERPHSIRTAFQRDRDRIIHSKSFRRLKHKTQVFLAPYGDHYRTRLTHTLEVSQIARTIARALRLNEDLTEGIALGHDLGHTPFGHAGEAALNKLMPGFTHYAQSLRVVEKLEYEGKGLNLSWEVRDGIFKHSKGRGHILDAPPGEMPATLEGQTVRVSDVIAYVNHDLDDAVRAGIIRHEDIPERMITYLGRYHALRIDRMVKDVIETTMENRLERISLSAEMNRAIVDLRDFLYEEVYFSVAAKEQHGKIDKILTDLFDYVMGHPGKYVKNFPKEDSQKKRVVDFIAGMTDLYALDLFENIFFPNKKIF